MEVFATVYLLSIRHHRQLSFYFPGSEVAGKDRNNAFRSVFPDPQLGETFNYLGWNDVPEVILTQTNNNAQNFTGH